MRQGTRWNAHRLIALGLAAGGLGAALAFAPVHAVAGDDSDLPADAVAASETPLSMVASPEPFELTQPDGSTFSAVMKGNGEVSWYDTEDGYAITQNSSGVWTYAQGLDTDGELLPSDARPDENDKPPVAPTLQPEPQAEPQPAPALDEPTPDEAPPFQHKGTARSLVILASFSDVGPTSQPSYWSNLFFGASGSLDDFYDQASYGNLRFQPAADSSGVNDGIVGWVNLGVPHPDLSSSLIGNSRATVAAAMTAADPFVDFAAYDTNGDNVIRNHELHVTVIMAGKESSVGGSNSCAGNGVWGHKSSLSQPPILDGKSVGGWGYTTFGEMHCRAPGVQNEATLGIVAHEMGHDIGWPDLYDTDHDSVGGVGEWSLMAFGSWNTAGAGPFGNSPALPDPFLKSGQGWVTPVEVAIGANASVLAASSNADVKRVLANPNGVDWNYAGSSGTGEYFLVENRSQTGFDAGLPGCGVLIWHVDESVTSTNAANANNAHRLLELEQADGQFDLNDPEFSVRGDAGDPWPGTAARTVFGPTSTPNSNLYSGAASGFAVTVTSASCGSTMNFSVASVGGAPPPVNDNFAAASPMEPTATATGSTALATLETNEVPHASNRGGKSVWWKVTPVANGSLTVDTETSTFDTLLGVYTGTAVNSLTPRAENDDTPTTTQSRVQLDVVAGTTYYIAVDGWRNAATGVVSSGAVTLHTAFSPTALAAPANDAFASATTINVSSGVNVNAQGPSFGATKQAGEPNHAGGLGGSSVWWKITPPSAGTLSVTTESSGFDSLLGVYTGASVGALTAVASNDDQDKPNNILTSRVAAFAVTAGVTYYIAVDGFANAEGYVHLQALFTQGPTAAAPGAPTGVSAFGGDSNAMVTWSAPASDGGAPITGYTVTASNGGATCGWTSGPLSCAVGGLTNGQPYSFTVRATNSAGTGPASLASNTVTLTAPPSGYVPLSPARVLETRPGLSTVDGLFNGIGPVGAGQVLNLTVTNRAGVPASGVGAVVVNVTATEPTGNGFLTVFPTGTARPTASNLNFTVGQTVPNLVVAKVGPSGQISIYNHAGSTHVIADVVGWFPATPGYVPLSPARVLETRPGLSTVDGLFNGIGPVGAGQVLNLTVTNRAGVPASGVGAVVVNVTATEPTGNGFLTVFPTGTARPTASNLNFTVGRTVPNLVIAKVGPSGQISIYNHAGSTHVIADVVGWFPASPGYVPLSPARALETRPGLSTVDGLFNGIGPVGAGQVLNLTVTNRAGVPASGVGAVVVNVTATEPTGNGFLTVFPTGTARPTASNLNFTVGQTVPNLVIAKVGPSGQISIYNHAGSTHVIADVVGWFPT